MPFRTSLRIATLTVAVWAGLASALPAQQQVDTRPGVAVLPFTNGGSIGPNREDLATWEVGLQQMLLTELAQHTSLRVVERSRLREILDELDLGRSGRVDQQTAARIGRLVGARYVLTGVFMDVNGNLRLDARVVDGETGEILRAREVRGRRDRIYDLLVGLSETVTRDLGLPPLAVNVQTERRARAIPPDAVTLYSKALALQDDGETDEAVELYRRISREFPQMTEAQDALRQLTGSS